MSAAAIPLALLRALGGVGGGRAANQDAAPVGPDFQSLLERAREGRLESGRAVQVSDGVTLDESQRARMSVAIDRAESAGAARAVVLMDGRAFEVDVTTRRVLTEVDAKSAQLVQHVDVVVSVPAAGAPRASGAGHVPGLMEPSPSLLSVLSSREEAPPA